MMRPLDEIAIDLLREHEPPEGYWLAFSGGKDSVVIKHLADRAGVKYRPFYNVTTIDPPDVIYFMRKHHPRVRFIRPTKPLLTAMFSRGFPLRQKPWCCVSYKESYHPDGVMIMGLRAEESSKRSKRKEYEQCNDNESLWFLNPIFRWASDEVWAYIRENGIPYCSLYDDGWKRIGCLFCPNARPPEKVMHAKRFPRYEQAFRTAFRRLYERRKAQGRTSVDRWQSGDEMFEWWING